MNKKMFLNKFIYFSLLKLLIYLIVVEIFLFKSTNQNKDKFNYTFVDNVSSVEQHVKNDPFPQYDKIIQTSQIQG